MSDDSLDQEQTKFTKRSYAFRQVPNAIDEMGLKPIEIVVWGHLESHKKGFNPTIKNMAKRFLCSEKTIERAITSLKKRNMVTIKKTKGKPNQYNLIKNIDDWVQTPETVPEKSSTDTRDGTVQTPETVGTDTRDGTSTDTRDGHKIIRKILSKKEKKKEDPPKIKNPSKYKFEQWQFDLARKWIEYHQEYYPGTNPKPDNWANQIRIICTKRKHLNQESFTALLDSIKSDSFWQDKATSIPSLNSPSKSNPDVLKIDQVLKGVKSTNMKPNYSIDDLFADELKAARQREANVIDVEFNSATFRI